ncbi:MAG TPA: helix-turn-helix domain-containing protein [Phenylobacterium sp.]|nr:helix-turn-helix domain-containing protein [Phenylobacterium sp.]
MPKSQRRRPRQDRALATQAAIFEAAAQILETEGEAGFNTNRVAERAGVSVGTLYQYFADKQAILVGIALRENAAVRAKILAEAESGTPPLRLVVRAQIAILADRPATRRAALRAIMAAEGGAVAARETRATVRLLSRPADADDLDLFVMDRAVSGVIRAAVLEGSPHLTDPRLEDALMRLVDPEPR